MNFRIHLRPFLVDPRSFDRSNSNINALDSVCCGCKCDGFFFLVPPATAVKTWWIFDENLGWLAIAWMLVAVLGVAMVVQRLQSQSKACEG